MFPLFLEVGVVLSDAAVWHAVDTLSDHWRVSDSFSIAVSLCNWPLSFGDI